MAEIEFSALSRQCLDRRIASQEKLAAEVLHWQARRNADAVKANWSFTTEKAREKLKKRYPEMANINAEIKSSEL